MGAFIIRQLRLLRCAIADIDAILDEDCSNPVAAETLFVKTTLAAGAVRRPTTRIEARVQRTRTLLLFGSLHVLADLPAIASLRSSHRDAEKDPKDRDAQT